MKNLKNLIALLLMVLFMSSFSSQLFKTTLKVTVRNELGNLESGAEVTLFKSKEDFDKGENMVISQTTDAKGNAQFENLEAIEYYIQAEKGDMNNAGAGEKTDKLVPNRLNKATIIISE